MTEATTTLTRTVVVEYMFSRCRLLEVGGFVSLPLGWFSDNATWIVLSGMGGIAGVPSAEINARFSSINLSSYSRDT